MAVPHHQTCLYHSHVLVRIFSLTSGKDNRFGVFRLLFFESLRSFQHGQTHLTMRTVQFSIHYQSRFGLVLSNFFQLRLSGTAVISFGQQHISDHIRDHVKILPVFFTFLGFFVA